MKNIFRKMGTSGSNAANDQNEEQVPQEETNNFDEKDKQIADLQTKCDEINDKYLRLYSEFDNFRKRTAKERKELIQSAAEDVFVSLLPVLDDFERAIKSNSETSDMQAVIAGVQLIFNKFNNTLSQKGLAPMNSVGETFDADVHEAITIIPAASEDLKGKVVEELEKGYSLNGKIIRFAKVVIAN